MYKLLLFSVTVAFCVISAKELSETDLILSESEITDYIFVDTTVNKQLLSNESELVRAEVNECKCKNGKCMRVCDVQKQTPCLLKSKVCTCPPGYAELKGECVACACGGDFNCIFKPVFYDDRRKTCLCPSDYIPYPNYDSYNDYCQPKCSGSRPCQNEGRCSFGQCYCRKAFRGDLCEKITPCRSKCENRLELDCNYDTSKEVAYCTCKNLSLFYDQEANICKPCPCGNGYCKYSLTYYTQELKCHCFAGYKEFKGYCRHCDCGPSGYCEFDSTGNKVCRCNDGYFEREGLCVLCGCMLHDTNCEVVENVKRCLCKEGYEDVMGRCEDINECEPDNPCHKSATCVNTLGGFICQCQDGYKGNSGYEVKAGEVCEDIDECEELSPACWRYNLRCVNVPGSYKCECLEGYEPSSYHIEPKQTYCISYSKSWDPALIVFFTTCALLIVLLVMHKCLIKRAARLN